MFQEGKVQCETDDGRNITLTAPYSYTTNSGEVITMPVGTDSDGGSIPRPLWSILPPFGNAWKAFVLHDYLYRHTQKPKQECDHILLEAMESLGVCEEKAMAIYIGVKEGGQEAFDQDRINARIRGEW